MKANMFVGVINTAAEQRHAVTLLQEYIDYAADLNEDQVRYICNSIRGDDFGDAMVECIAESMPPFSFIEGEHDDAELCIVLDEYGYPMYWLIESIQDEFGTFVALQTLRAFVGTHESPEVLGYCATVDSPFMRGWLDRYAQFVNPHLRDVNLTNAQIIQGIRKHYAEQLIAIINAMKVE